MSLDLTDDKVNTGSANGLVLSGNKPLLEPMLTHIYAPMVSLGHNELTLSLELQFADHIEKFSKQNFWKNYFLWISVSVYRVPYRKTLENEGKGSENFMCQVPIQYILVNTQA